MLQMARTYISAFAQYLSKDEKGATAIEYGLIAALVSVVMIATLILVGTSLDTTFQNVDNALNQS